MKNALAESCDVTTVEAGNIFSPRAWTCGISAVWQSENDWKSTENLSLDELEWRSEDGEKGVVVPVLRSSWREGAANFTHRLTHLSSEVRRVQRLAPTPRDGKGGQREKRGGYSTQGVESAAR